MSEFQSVVLLQFNGPAEVPLTYTSIAEATGIEKSQLDRTLLSLAAGKNQRVLIMKPLASLPHLIPNSFSNNHSLVV